MIYEHEERPEFDVTVLGLIQALTTALQQIPHGLSHVIDGGTILTRVVIHTRHEQNGTLVCDVSLDVAE